MRFQGNPHTSSGISPKASRSSRWSGAGAALGAGIAGPIGMGIGSAIAGSFGNKGDGYNTYRSHQRKLWASERAHLKLMPSALTEGARRAGLHPLAALGMAPSGSAASPMSPPGQSSTGSLFAQGVNRAMQYKSAQLGLEQQQLQNELIKDQIKASKIARVSQAANAKQDVTKAVVFDTIAGGKATGSVAQPPEHTGKGQGVNLFGLMGLKQRPGSLTAQGAEDALGEPANWIYNLFNVPATIGYNLDRKIWKTPARRKSDLQFGTHWTDVDPYADTYDY